MIKKFIKKTVGNKTKLSEVTSSIAESVLDGNWLSFNCERPYIQFTEEDMKDITDELTSRTKGPLDDRIRSTPATLSPIALVALIASLRSSVVVLIKAVVPPK